VRDLPVETQQLLLVAAADPTGDSALLWRALARLGVPPESAVPAETEGLLEFGARILFRHPLLRSAVYGAASDEERRVAHGALAAATDVELDPDRRAWHRAWATLVVDEDVAAELERSAVRAHARGGLPAAAAFLERAAAITPEIGTRTRRVLAAAEAKLLAGAPQTALGLLATVAVGPLVERDRATLQRYRGQIALDLRHGADATDLLLDAARRLEPFDPDLARDTYVDALRAASISGRLGDRTLEAAEAARNAPAPTGAPRAIDLLLDSLALRFTEGYVPSVPGLKEALRAVLDEETRGVEDVRWPWSGRRVAPDLFDDDTWRTLALLNVQRARDQGALAVLPLALHYLAQFRVFEGNFDSATALVDEADGVADAIGSERIEIGSVLLAGCRGDEARGLQALEDSQRRAAVRGEGVLLTFGEHARAVLFNGLGRYNEALTPAVSAYTRDELCASTWSIAEAVEAAARCGREGVAAEALGRLAERTRAVGSEWALGVEARSRAIVEDGARADELYCEAIYRLGSCRMAFDRARAHLLYGEWLRRKRRRVDAREQLRTAHDLFTQMGAQAFAGRAARELRATGEKMQRREAHTRDQLTAQEVQIAWLARDGLSNPEIAAQLFISPRTVEYHLHKVFGKLAIGRRSQLVRVLGEAR
jgi:DNA-binding CsgD family transcriptional regulator